MASLKQDLEELQALAEAAASEAAGYPIGADKIYDAIQAYLYSISDNKCRFTGNPDGFEVTFDPVISGKFKVTFKDDNYKVWLRERNLPDEVELSYETGVPANTVQSLIDANCVVQVTAADFNGREFDGAPLRLIGGNAENLDQVQWLKDALSSSKIHPESRGGSDYAYFSVEDENGEVSWAGPGDYIVNIQWGARPQDSYLHVLSGRLLVKLGFLDIQALALLQASIADLKTKKIDPVVIADKVSRVSSHSYEPDPENPRV